MLGALLADLKAILLETTFHTCCKEMDWRILEHRPLHEEVCKVRTNANLATSQQLQQSLTCERQCRWWPKLK